MDNFVVLIGKFSGRDLRLTAERVPISLLLVGSHLLIGDIAVFDPDVCGQLLYRMRVGWVFVSSEGGREVISGN